MFSNQLWDRWQSILNDLHRAGIASFPVRVLRLLKQFVVTSGKFEFVTSPGPFDGEETTSDQDDVYWLRLAVQFQSVGVTTDNRLLNNENDAAILEHHSVGLMRPAAALARLAT